MELIRNRSRSIRAAVSDRQTYRHDVHVRPCKARSQISEKRLLASVSVCLSVGPQGKKNSSAAGRIFMKFDIWVFLENLSRKFSLHYNLPRITALYMNTDVQLWSYHVQFFSEWEMFHTKVVKETATHILSNFSLENLAFYEITWGNIVEPHRSRDNIIRRMRIACWIPDATNSH